MACIDCRFLAGWRPRQAQFAVSTQPKKTRRVVGWGRRGAGKGARVRPLWACGRVGGAGDGGSKRRQRGRPIQCKGVRANYSDIYDCLRDQGNHGQRPARLTIIATTTSTTMGHTASAETATVASTCCCYCCCSCCRRLFGCLGRPQREVGIPVGSGRPPRPGKAFTNGFFMVLCCVGWVLRDIRPQVRTSSARSTSLERC